MPSTPPPPLDPSELGTKEYWDTTYTSDLATHDSTPSHTGTTWFADANAEPKLLRYLCSSALGLSRTETTFLDLGCGNGSMLFLLREKGGFEGAMVGVDYSEGAVRLGTEIAEGKRSKDSREKMGEVRFERWDVLGGEEKGKWGGREEWMVEGGFDIVMDKGTFDAVSLGGADGEGKRVEEVYVERVAGLVREGGLVLITSCNWTEAELRGWFERKEELEFVGRIEYPVYKFGGVVGQSVSSVCFRRVGEARGR